MTSPEAPLLRAFLLRGCQTVAATRCRIVTGLRDERGDDVRRQAVDVATRLPLVARDNTCSTSSKGMPGTQLHRLTSVNSTASVVSSRELTLTA